jgi:circadian clock protein KaiC
LFNITPLGGENGVTSLEKNNLEMRKTPTGIAALDKITNSGLPQGRTTLIAGGAGSGKTLEGMELLVGGIEKYGEAGIAMTFEETMS